MCRVEDCGKQRSDVIAVNKSLPLLNLVLNRFVLVLRQMYDSTYT